MPCIAIICMGSRGDVEPFIALSQTLLSRSHTIHLLVQPDYAALVPPHPSLHIHHLPFTLATLTYHFIPLYLKYVLNPFENTSSLHMQNVGMSTAIARFITPHISTFYSLLQPHSPSLILSTLLPALTAHALSEAFSIPCAIVLFQPISATKYYPIAFGDETSASSTGIFSLPNAATPSETNLTTYYDLYDLLHTPSLPALNSFRTSHNLPSITLPQLRNLYTAALPNVHVVHAFNLVPRAPDFHPNLHSTSALAADYLPPNFSPDDYPQTQNYLKNNPNPLVIAMSSTILFDSIWKISRNLLTALRMNKVENVLIVQGQTKLGPSALWRWWDSELIEWSKKHVKVVEEKPPFAWLFPQCRAVFCHGGAGTLFAALAAGKRVVIGPVGTDQFLWGKLVEMQGRGAIVRPNLRDAKLESYVEAIRTCLEKEQGECVKGGREESVEIIEQLIS